MQIFNPWALLLVLLIVPGLVFIILRSFDAGTRLRRTIAGVLRIMVVLAVIADLLVIQVWWADRKQKLCVYYLVDLSVSMQPYRKQLAVCLRENLNARSSDSSVGVIVFDAKPRVIAPATTAPDVAAIVAEIEGQDLSAVRSASALELDTNIQEAFRLAMSSFPSDQEKRICLISDCNETEGNALLEAQRIKEAGVSIYAFDPKLAVRPDVAVEGMRLGKDVNLNQSFDVTVKIISTIGEQEAGGGAASLQLYRNNVRVASSPLALKRGSQEVTFRQRLERGGRFLYETRLDTVLAQNPENDRTYMYLELMDLPRLLVIANSPEERRLIPNLFRGARVDLELRTSRGLPQTMLDLQEFAAVVIGNIPASLMTRNQMKLLHDYVREFGGSLIMTGGDKALSAGGYGGTVMEQVLPARLAFEEKEIPVSAVVFILDTSASLELKTYDFEGKKTEFVQRFAMSAVDVLSERDYFGLLGFGGNTRVLAWLVPLQKVVDRQALKQLALVYEQRRSSFFEPLSEAYQGLIKINSPNKHIIIVSDGYVQSGINYEHLAMQFAASDISISCVALGHDANRKMLEGIARWGNGRYFVAENVAEATKILEREVQELAQAVVVEKPTKPLVLEQNSEIFAGVDMNLVPTLFGYVRVKPKLAAQTIMVTKEARDPLLLTWQYGAGRVTIFNTDLGGGWTQLWVSDWGGEFTRLWQNLVTWSMKREPGVVYLPHVRTRGWELQCSVDALDEKRKFVNNAPPAAGLYPLGEQGQVFSEASRINIPMRQTGPGQYESSHKVNRRGIYLFKAARTNGTGVACTGAVIADSREMAFPLPNLVLRQKLCELARGRVVAESKEVFEKKARTTKRSHDLGIYLLLAACFLFALDVTARRWPAVLAFFKGASQR